MAPFTRPATRRGRSSEHTRLLQCVQGILDRSDRATPWEPDTVGLPDTPSDSALARINDVAFYANARDEVAALAGVCVDLLRLHTPEEGRAHRCQGCRLEWPCPSFAEISRLLG